MIRYISQLPKEYQERLQKISGQLSEARVAFEDFEADLLRLWEGDHVYAELTEEITDMRERVEEVESELDDELDADPFCLLESGQRNMIGCLVLRPTRECPADCQGRRKYA